MNKTIMRSELAAVYESQLQQTTADRIIPIAEPLRKPRQRRLVLCSFNILQSSIFHFPEVWRGGWLQRGPWACGLTSPGLQWRRLIMRRLVRHQKPQHEINKHAGERGEHRGQHPNHAQPRRRPAGMLGQAAAHARNPAVRAGATRFHGFRPSRVPPLAGAFWPSAFPRRDKSTRRKNAPAR